MILDLFLLAWMYIFFGVWRFTQIIIFLAYPSLKQLGSWARDLKARVEHFASWAETMRPPLFFWLAAYTFPTGFLTAVLQVGLYKTTI